MQEFLEAKRKQTTFASDLYCITINSVIMKTMKKCVLLLSTLLLLGTNVINAAPIDFGVGIIDPKPGFPGSSKGPTNTPSVDLDGNFLTFEEGHDDYTLCIVDANDIIVYSSYVPSTQTIINLPSTLSGEYQLRLIPDGSNIYFYGYVLF